MNVTRKWATSIVAVAVIGAFAAGCGSDGSSSSDKDKSASSTSTPDASAALGTREEGERRPDRASACSTSSPVR